MTQASLINLRNLARRGVYPTNKSQAETKPAEAVAAPSTIKSPAPVKPTPSSGFKFSPKPKTAPSAPAVAQPKPDTSSSPAAVVAQKNSGALDPMRYERQVPSAETVNLVGGEEKTAAGHSMMVDRLAAQSLLNLVAAVTLDSGNANAGQQEPLARRAALAQLIATSHTLAEDFAQRASGGQATRSLRGGMLYQMAQILGRHWSKTGDLQIDDFKELACHILEDGHDVVAQDALELMSIAQQDARKQAADINSASAIEERLHLARLRAGWQLYRKASSDRALRLSNYVALDPDEDLDKTFSYGRTPAQISQDLLACVTRIVSANRPVMSLPGLACKWEEAAINRAAVLVGSAYVGTTRKDLLKATSNELMSGARMESMCKQWDWTLEQIEKSSNSLFVEIDRQARASMEVGKQAIPVDSFDLQTVGAMDEGFEDVPPTEEQHATGADRVAEPAKEANVEQGSAESSAPAAGSMNESDSADDSTSPPAGTLPEEEDATTNESLSPSRPTPPVFRFSRPR